MEIKWFSEMGFSNSLALSPRKSASQEQQNACSFHAHEKFSMMFDIWSNITECSLSVFVKYVSPPSFTSTELSAGEFFRTPVCLILSSYCTFSESFTEHVRRKHVIKEWSLVSNYST